MQRHSGFTLIELMVTVAVVAILASIALPLYTSYITRSKLSESTSALLAQRVKMEQFYQDKLTYAGACLPGTAATPPTLKYFTITCPVASATAYTVQAAGGTAGDSTLEGITFTINERMDKATTVTPGSKMADAGYIGAACWVTKSGGVC